MEDRMPTVEDFVQIMDELHGQVVEHEERLQSMCHDFANVIGEHIDSMDLSGTVWVLRVADSLSTTVPYRLQLHLDLDLHKDLDNSINNERFSWLRMMRYLGDHEEILNISIEGGSSSIIMVIKKVGRRSVHAISVHIEFGSPESLVRFIKQKKIVLSQNGISLEKNKVNNALKEFYKKAAYLAEVEEMLNSEEIAGYYGEYIKKD
jgi:hypothetical protein